MIRFYGEEAGYTILGGGLQSISMLSGGALGGDVVFTRNSAGWDWGLVQYAIDTPRYYGGGLIVEKEQLSITRSLDNYSGTYQIATGVADPSGGTAGYTATRNVGTSQLQNNNSFGSPFDPYYPAQTVLMRIDSGTVDTVRFFIGGRNTSDDGFVGGNIRLNINDGTISSSVASLYRLQVIGDWVLARSVLTSQAADYSGFNWSNTQFTLYADGVSATEAGWSHYKNVAGTPIVTPGSSSITRAADYVSQDLSGVVTDTHQVHIDVELAWGIGPVGGQDEYQVLESMDDGTGNEGVEIVRYGDGTIRLRVIDGGVVTVNQSLGTVTNGQRLKIWRGYDAGDHYAQIEGGTLVQVTAAMPSGRIERIGSRGHTDGAEHAQSCANHYTHVVYPGTLSASMGQAFIA